MPTIRWDKINALLYPPVPYEYSFLDVKVVKVRNNKRALSLSIQHVLTRTPV